MLIRVGIGFRKSFATAFPKPVWLAVSLLITALLGLLLERYGFQAIPKVRDPFYFLLATLAATLGTVLVLAFTFALVAAQIAARYSQLLSDRVLGNWAFWYAAPFAAGILIPLFLLHGRFHLWSVQFSLILGAYCIVSLFPFAASVRRLLSVNEAIQEKTGNLESGKTQCDCYRVANEIGNICLGALNLKDFETFERGVRRLVHSSKTNGPPYLRPAVATEIRRMVLRTGDDLFASEILLRAMIEIGFDRTSDSDVSIQEQVLNEILGAYESVNVSALQHQSHTIDLLFRESEQAIEQCRTRVAAKLQNLLYVIGGRAISGLPMDLDCGGPVIAALGNLVQAEYRSSLDPAERDDLIIAAVIQIESLGTAARAVNKSTVKISALTELQRAERTFEDETEGVIRSIRASLAELR